MTAPPETPVEAVKSSPLRRISLVWLVPLAALAVALFIVWQNYNERGPVIEISFENASGIRAEETELRFRDVTVGVVEAVTFAPDLGSVIVSVQIDKSVAPYVDEDAEFWVVRPQVTAQGVSGLDTVLSGVFLAGSWNQEAGTALTEFEGRASAPLVRNDQPGLAITLRSTTVDGLAEGTAILYRGIDVGTIGNLRLGDDGVSVLADGFIRAPHDRLVTSSTRFWDTSGFDFSFGAQGAQLNVSSLASLITGGVAFDTTVSTGEPVDTGAIFTLFTDEETARASVFSDSATGDSLQLAVIFDDAVSGLDTGAPVEFQGIEVGRVDGLTGVVDEARFGDRRVRLLTTLSIQPEKMGLPDDAVPVDFVDGLVRDGLRAQLQTASILGGLRVSLTTPEARRDAAPRGLDREAEPYPLIPSVPAELSDFSDTAEGVFSRVNALPIEELLGAAIAVMDSADRLLNSEGLTDTPAEALALLGEVRGLIASDGVQGIPGDVSDVLVELRTAIADADTILREISDAGTVVAVTEAVAATEAAADDVAASVADLPTLLAAAEQALVSVDALIQTANALPLDALATEAVGALADARGLLTDPAVTGLIADLSATVAEAQGLVSDVRNGGLIEGANAIVASARTAIAEVQAALTPVLAAAERAAVDVGAAASGLPQVIDGVDGLVAEIDVLVTQVNALPLAEVVARTTALIGSAEAIVAAPATQQLPAELGAALAEAQGLIADVRAGGLVESAGATLATAETVIADLQSALTPVLAAAERAAGDVGSAVAGLPQVIEGVDGLVAEIDVLVTQVNALPLADVVARTSAILGSAESIVAAPATQQLPADLSLALTEAQGLIGDIREGGLVDSAGATLAATERAVNDVAAALTPVLEEARRAALAIGDATDAVPGLVDRAQSIAGDVETLVAQARDLPLDTLVTRANNLLASANLFVGSPEAAGVPVALNAALAEVQRVLAAVREGGLIENANTTLTSTQEASAAIAEASAQLPRLVTQVNSLLAQTEGVIGGYDANGALGSEARAALRDIRDAARSFDSLARSIERNPNSLLVGR